jgi:hypothetical protein
MSATNENPEHIEITERKPDCGAATGSEVPTPRTDAQLHHAIDFGIAVDVNFARQLEREVLRLGEALNEQNERWGLYGNESQAALRAFKELNASAGLPNAKLRHGGENQ